MYIFYFRGTQIIMVLYRNLSNLLQKALWLLFLSKISIECNIGAGAFCRSFTSKEPKILNYKFITCRFWSLIKCIIFRPYIHNHNIMFFWFEVDYYLEVFEFYIYLKLNFFRKYHIILCSYLRWQFITIDHWYIMLIIYVISRIIHYGLIRILSQ